MTDDAVSTLRHDRIVVCDHVLPDGILAQAKVPLPALPRPTPCDSSLGL